MLGELNTLQAEYSAEYEKEASDFWNSLSDERRLLAFYSVVKRIVQGEIVNKRTYRGVLYDVFGFGPEAYVVGMECGYIDLHNKIP